MIDFSPVVEELENAVADGCLMASITAFRRFDKAGKRWTWHYDIKRIEHERTTTARRNISLDYQHIDVDSLGNGENVTGLGDLI